MTQKQVYFTYKIGAVQFLMKYSIIFESVDPYHSVIWFFLTPNLQYTGPAYCDSDSV